MLLSRFLGSNSVRFFSAGTSEAVQASHLVWIAEIFFLREFIEKDQ